MHLKQFGRKILKRERYDGIRLRGIPELVSSNSRERYEQDLKEVKAIAKRLIVTAMSQIESDQAIIRKEKVEPWSLK